MNQRPEIRRRVLPRRVREGDTVAIVAPCSSEVFWPPHRGDRGVAYLEGLGLSVKVMPHAGAEMAGKRVTPQERAADINAAFADPAVAVVLCSIGGNESIDVVPFLDFEMIRGSQKIFQGLSDATVLHWAIRGRSGLVTFHGPALLPELAEFPKVFEYTDRYLRASWFGDEAVSFQPAQDWTDEFLDWMKQLDLTRPRMMQPSTGWRTLRPGRATGPLVGGCLETICQHLLGTEFLSFDGAIAFFETSELRPSPNEVAKYLESLLSSGALRGVRGLILGRPYAYTHAEKLELWAVMTDVSTSLGIPALADVECGHTDPMLTMPFGLEATFNCSDSMFVIEEVATQDVA